MTDIASYERRVMRAVNARLHAHLARASAADADLATTFGDPEDLAEAMVSALPHSHVFDEIAGPFYDTAGLTRWLGITRQALHQKAVKHAILACPSPTAEPSTRPGNSCPTAPPCPHSQKSSPSCAKRMTTRGWPRYGCKPPRNLSTITGRAAGSATAAIRNEY